MKFQAALKWITIPFFFFCLFSVHAKNYPVLKHNPFAVWTLKAMHEKTLRVDEAGTIYYSDDSECNIPVDESGNCKCFSNDNLSIFKPELLAQSSQSQPIIPFDGVPPEETPYPIDWFYEYCGCYCGDAPTGIGKPVHRSYAGYFYSTFPYLMSSPDPDTPPVPDYLGSPKHDIDINVYDMSDFEQVDTSTGILKLSHHDVHYPGNAGMDIDLYRVYENRPSYQTGGSAFDHELSYGGLSLRVGHGGYYLSAGFMLFDGTLCETSYRNVPATYTYIDERFNRHVFAYDAKRYQMGNEVSNEKSRAHTFYSDTGWKGVCELEIKYQPKDGDNNAYYYVNNMSWTLYPPDGREIKLNMDIDFTDTPYRNDPEVNKRVRAFLKKQERDRFGNTMTYDWIGAGRSAYDTNPFKWLGLKRITTSDGRQLTFDWDGYRPAHRAGEEEVPAKMLNYNLTITDNNSRSWQYINTQSTMPDGRVWQHQYNAAKDVIEEVINPFGGKHSYTYKLSTYPELSAKTRYIIQTKSFTQPNSSIATWQYHFDNDDQYKIPVAIVTAPDSNQSRYTYWNGLTAFADNSAGSSWIGDNGHSCYRKGKLQLAEQLDSSGKLIRQTKYYYHADKRYFTPNTAYYKNRCYVPSGYVGYSVAEETTENNKKYRTDYSYTNSRISNEADLFAVKAWRELKPEKITHTGSGVSQTTHYQYNIKDQSTCTKVTQTPPWGNNTWSPDKPCKLGTITGHYFVGVTSAKTDGIPLGVTTNYDPNHFRVTSQNTYGVNTSQTWHTSGSSKGSLRTATDAAGNTTSFNDYQRGIPKSETLPTGNSITRTVDNIGVVKSVSVRDAKTNKTLTTTYDHTPIGLLSGVKLPKYTSAKTAAAYTWGSAANTVIKRGDFKQTNYYDRLGRETEKVYQVGSETIRYKTDYDLNGRVQKSYYPNASNGVTYQYDGLGRVVKTCDPRGCSTTQYDGDHVTVTDAKGKATTYTYQRFGAGLHTELVAIRSPENIGTQITRNKKGDILSVRQGTVSNYNATTKAFSLINAKTRSLSYFTDKGLGLRTVSDPERGTLTYGRDNAGRITTETLDGKTKTLRYDPLNRVDRVTFNREAHLNKTFGYDAWGRLIASNNSIINWAYGYDDNGNPTSAKLTVNNKTYEANYTHDNLDHLETLTYPSGRKLSYDVDALGRVNSIYKGSTGIVRAANYHPNGTVKTLRLGNGSQYTTDINSRQLINLIAVDGNKVKLTYGYDPVGNVSQITQSGQATKTMTYDDLHRLKKVAYSNGGSANYTYDALSNIKTKVLSSIAGATNTNWTYGYDANNRLTGIRGSTYSGFGYDGAGNVIRDGKHSYGYNVNHQLASIDSGERAYAYDANDDRIFESHGKQNSQKQVNFYHGGTLLGEYSEANQAVKREYVQLGNHTIAQFGGTASTSNPNYIFRDSFEAFPPPRSLDLLDFTPKAGSETLTYLYKDALGSTITKADSTGKILWQENRLPFGKNTQLNNNQIAKNPLQYTNAPLDTHSGLTYLKARYYNAEIGRFYAIDPLWFTEDNVQMFNRYAYANNSPYRYIDPTGMQGDDVQDMINDLRDARRGGKTKAEFEAHANDTLVDSVKVAGKTAAGIAPLGKLGNFFGKLGSKLGFGRNSKNAIAEITFSQKQLNKKFKHAANFGVVTTKKNPKTLAQFENAIKSHLADKNTVKKGTYGLLEESKVFYNAKTKNAVVLDKENNFVTGFNLKVDTKQYQHFINKGILR